MKLSRATARETSSTDVPSDLLFGGPSFVDGNMQPAALKATYIHIPIDCCQSV